MEAVSYQSHVLILPFPGQGHLNPMLCFSERLASKGIKITVTATVSSIKNLPPQSPHISLEPIYDESTHGGVEGPGGFFGFVQRLESTGKQNLINLVQKHQESKNPIKCLIYDVNFPWALDLARQIGIMGVAFVTQSCATVLTYLKIMQEIANDSPDPLALVPEYGFDKLPLMGSNTGKIPSLLAYILSHLEGIDKADLVLFNSFDKLEEEEVKDLSKHCSIRTIGPTLSPTYLEKRVENDDSLGKLTGDTCMDWLNTKKTGSVLYVAFGSAVTHSAEQMEELAWGLKQSNTDFLWVVRASEDDKLPVTFKEEISDEGLVVSWSSQLDVLSHKAVGCFMTHCGWNSTVEAVSLGVPMIAIPHFADQFGDAKFVEKVWEVGMRAQADEKGLIAREEIQRCIREVMEGEKGEKIKRNALKWKELAVKAMADGGTSDRNIADIVAKLVN